MAFRNIVIGSTRTFAANYQVFYFSNKKEWTIIRI